MTFLSKIGNGFKNTFGTVISFLGESYSELRKVRWPTRKELISYTIVVIVTVAIITVYFAVLDLGISNVIRWVLGRD